MRIKSWWRRRSRERRRKQAAEENRHEPLREFVYLDEVSVFSLLASRIGALATDFTESESSSLSSEVRFGVGAIAPVAKANVSSSLKGNETSGTQVMRKSTVQSTFRELYGYVRHSFVLGPPTEDVRPPSVDRPGDVAREALKGSQWALDASALLRGQLLEVEVELDADESFQVSTIFSTMLEFVEELPQVANALDREALADVVGGTRLLQKLLAGLVPLRGHVNGYSSVEVDGTEFIVHDALRDGVPGLKDRARPLYVVGVAEENLFWRDIRRVLFSGSRYRMLCRVARDGVHGEWTPVKLLDVLGSAVPPLRGLVDEIPVMLSGMRTDERADGGSSWRCGRPSSATPSSSRRPAPSP